MKIQRTPVESSQLKSVGYSLSTQQLDAEFANGGVYRYSKIPPNLHAKLMNADSQGKFFATEIRPKYKGVKLDEKEAAQ